MKTIMIVLLSLMPVPVFAVDGQVLVNQASVTAAGGFPYVISQPGSYKLSGNLIVPIDANGISITASNVSVDLNGFSITSLGFSGFSRPYGIITSTSITNITIRNGSMSNWTPAIAFFSPSGQGIIEDLNFQENFTVNGSNVTNAYAIASTAHLRIKGVTTEGQMNITCPSVVIDTIANAVTRFGVTTGCVFGNSSIAAIF